MTDIIGAIARLRSTAARLDELNLSGHASDIRAVAAELEPRNAVVVRLPTRPREWIEPRITEGRT